MKTILAEKPSVARDIARIVGATQRKDGFLEGNNYRVTWAIGHLVGLALPAAYGYEKWSIENLPIIPDYFKLEVAPDLGIKRQFRVIKELFKEANEIIVATDAGREGELIFRYIYTLAKPKSDISIFRLWISDLTDKTIKKGLQELKPISNYDNLYYSGKARSEADWLVGINMTQAITVASQKGKPLSIGRVQTATLRIIVDRYLENTSFNSVPFYVPKIILQNETGNFEMQSDERFDDIESATNIIQNINGTYSKEIIVENKETEEKSPLLYDLTTLQREANKAFGLTAKQTLDIAQNLYEKHKATTYPRTDSQYLATNQVEDVKGVFNAIPNFKINDIELTTLHEICIKNVSGHKIFNDNKISDHHAIIPTTEVPDLNILNSNEKRVYLMIVRRYYQTFMDPCRKSNRNFKTHINDIPFSCSSTVITSPGWRALFPKNEEKSYLPDIPTGIKKLILDSTVLKGMTKPKPLFTENSLLAIMETAGKLVEDKELKESLKEKGLGTSATRAGIIETLIKREYILRQKGKLIPTEIAIELIKRISHLSICSPELTGTFEQKLIQMEKGSYSYSTFKREIETYVKDLLPEIIKSGQSISQVRTEAEKQVEFNYGKCPKCKEGVIKKGKKGVYCSNWNSDPKCNFTIWLTVAKKKLSDKQINNLVQKGKSDKINGFISKHGNKFSGTLILDSDFKVQFDFN